MATGHEEWAPAGRSSAAGTGERAAPPAPAVCPPEAPAACLRKAAVLRARRAFTLVEILATLTLAAIVLPAVMHGISRCLATATSARQQAQAASLAHAKLSELVATGQLQHAELSGDFGPDWPDYRWVAQVLDWDVATLSELNVTVLWRQGGLDHSVTMTTLVYSGGCDMIRPIHRARGFTLLEVLVATAMMAVLAGALYATLHVAFKARNAAAHAVESVRKCEAAMNLIKEDLQSAAGPNGLLAGPFMGTKGGGGSTGLSDSLAFYAAVNDVEPDTGIGDIKKVEFACDLPGSVGTAGTSGSGGGRPGLGGGGSAGGRPGLGGGLASGQARAAGGNPGTGDVLVRRLTTNLLSVVTLDPQQEILCRGVRSLTFLYWDGTTWYDSWDSTAMDNLLPLAVAVTLELTDPGTSSQTQVGYRLTRIVLIPCGQPAPDDTTDSSTSSSSMVP